MAFNLESITTGIRKRPVRTIIYGEQKIGKTTFASQAPGVVILPTEEGADALDVASFPLAKTYDHVLEAIASLYSSESQWSHLALDSADWLEDLIWKHVASEAGVSSVSEIPYGKGFAMAADKMREVLSGFDALRNERGFGIIILAHSQIRRFDDPSSEPYDRYCLKLHKTTSAILQEWADIIGFATQEVIVKQENVGFNAKASRGVTVGGRVLKLSRTPAYDAGSRWPMPESVSLDWGSFASALEESQSNGSDPKKK